VVDVDTATYLLSEVMAKKYSSGHNIWALWGMSGNVTRVSILGPYVLCEMNSGKALELSKSKAWFMKESTQ
jgi:hypothetical protein